MKANDEVRIKIWAWHHRNCHGFFLAFMGFVCFAGYVLMVSEPLRNTFIMYIGGNSIPTGFSNDF